MKATRRPLRDRQGVQEENDAANNNGLKKRKRSNKEEGEGEIIALEGNLQSIGSNVTFEFKDADDMHIESLTILLKTLVTNPTKAFEIATSLATDGECKCVPECATREIVGEQLKLEQLSPAKEMLTLLLLRLLFAHFIHRFAV